ncbi:hypothetical protein BAY1663_04564 [Pseudomonas sp. BAY1663]|jgi:hypothetical protein|uniref:hypothetical protein n=1 Tax=Pseudomonas sp. BAY1663 TaxID=1439940 RepID=UPI00042E050D|nr:hypothetical protein [Pseudomonas sp. BAY1663]EXF43017.1 hypothetical protein BAY1663_04564 [Pseudomonas sp. BAY1663]
MIRIHGRIGDWPVDLTIELDEQDWERLAQVPGLVLEAGGRNGEGAAPPAEALWHSARECLRRAGKLDGPQLLAELEALTGSMQTAKRLLVRLRHCDQVRVESGPDMACYHWIGDD